MVILLSPAPINYKLKSIPNISYLSCPTLLFNQPVFPVHLGRNRVAPRPFCSTQRPLSLFPSPPPAALHPSAARDLLLSRRSATIPVVHPRYSPRKKQQHPDNRHQLLGTMESNNCRIYIALISCLFPFQSPERTLSCPFCVQSLVERPLCPCASTLACIILPSSWFTLCFFHSNLCGARASAAAAERACASHVCL
jgi:hypothetical protein